MPTFVSGWARLLDLGGVYDIYNESRNGSEADVCALYSDFRMIGQDLQEAMEIFRADHYDRLSPERLRAAFQQKDAEIRRVGKE